MVVEQMERYSSSSDRLSAMSVPERLSVDSEEKGQRVRKNSDLSSASDHMTVPDRLLVDDMTNPYQMPHLDTPPKQLTMGNMNRRSHGNGTVSAPIPGPNFEQDDDILTLANRILTLHQKVLTLEAKISKQNQTTLMDSLLEYVKMFGVSFAAAYLLQYFSRR